MAVSSYIEHNPRGRFCVTETQVTPIYRIREERMIGSSKSYYWLGTAYNVLAGGPDLQELVAQALRRQACIDRRRGAA